jgi:hypothetical protein
MANIPDCDFIPLNGPMPDTPTVTPLVDEGVAIPLIFYDSADRVRRLTILADTLEKNGGRVSVQNVALLVSDLREAAALRPVEADDAGLIERLTRAAKQSSDIHRRIAEDKSLRQEDNLEGRTDLYAWPTPEQTLEGQAAARLASLSAAKVEAEKEVERLADALAGLLTVVEAADSVKRGDFYHERKSAKAALKGRTQGDGE